MIEDATEGECEMVRHPHPFLKNDFTAQKRDADISKDRRKDFYKRTSQEQLDYEMDLLRAQREGREEEFKKEASEKLRASRAAVLDAEMDDYFSKGNAAQQRENENRSSTNKESDSAKKDAAATSEKDTAPIGQDDTSEQTKQT